MNKNSTINSSTSSSTSLCSSVMGVSKREMEAKRAVMTARNKLNHIPALVEEKRVSLKDLAREELYAGSKLGVAIAFASLSNHRKELYARYGRYQIKTTYDTGDMMWHIYLM